MSVQNLLSRVRELELTAKKQAVSVRSGLYESAFAGRGMVFREARKYVPGDTVRHIDWNVTSRMGEPYVRTFQDEREREVIVCLDCSESMDCGFQESSSLEFGILLAATLLCSAMQGRDSLGLCTYAQNVVDFLPPSAGRKQFYSLLEVLAALKSRPGGTDIRSAIQKIEESRKRRFVLFFISDFIDEDLASDLILLRQVHDISLLHVYDPLEFKESPLFFPAVSAETRESGRFRAKNSQSLTFREDLRTRAAGAGILAESFSTAEPAGLQLGHFLHAKSRLQARRAV